ncbi:MAG: hypothetical protein QXP70_04755 [Methanomassiliicoccales archaeon]
MKYWVKVALVIVVAAALLVPVGIVLSPQHHSETAHPLYFLPPDSTVIADYRVGNDTFYFFFANNSVGGVAPLNISVLQQSISLIPGAVVVQDKGGMTQYANVDGYRIYNFALLHLNASQIENATGINISTANNIKVPLYAAQIGNDYTLWGGLPAVLYSIRQSASHTIAAASHLNNTSEASLYYNFSTGNVSSVSASITTNTSYLQVNFTGADAAMSAEENFSTAYGNILKFIRVDGSTLVAELKVGLSNYGSASSEIGSMVKFLIKEAG